MLYCDTRQQEGKHAHVDRWLGAHNVAFEYRKLDFGDYMTETSNISVDTKRDVQEVANNVGRAHARFVRECERAAAAGCRLVVLVEEHPEYNDRGRLAGWTNRVCLRCQWRRYCTHGCERFRARPIQGATVAKIVATLEERHGVRFEFCRRGDTARRICELLGVDYER